MKYTIAIAGTTKNTTQCAKAILKDSHFEIIWTLTPKPKIIGRRKILTSSPLNKFSEQYSIDNINVDKKIDDKTKKQIKNLKRPDFLLVVDFGYIIPNWLLNYPKKYPLNIHPSKLPKWRGSSPGQFSMLFGEKTSAVSLMIMNHKLDQGNIVYQENFNIDRNWKQTEYYTHAFNLISQVLPGKILDLGLDKIQTMTQTIKSPTITARSLKKTDGFVNWTLILNAMNNSQPSSTSLKQISPLLIEANKTNKSWSITIDRACKAFSPWPGIWTLITNKSNNKKRMKILSTTLKKDKLQLNIVQIEGKNPNRWDEIKENIQ